MNITFVTTAYKETYDPYMFVSSLLLQKNSNWKCIIYCDEANQQVVDAVNLFKDDRFKVVANETATKYWGHYNRKRALHELVDSEFVIQTSIQDYYTPNAVEEILGHSTFDFIYFDMIHNHFNYEVLDTIPERNHIDWGSFAVRTSVAKRIDIVDLQACNCDGIFAERCFLDPDVRSIKLEKILAVHN